MVRAACILWLVTLAGWSCAPAVASEQYVAVLRSGEVRLTSRRPDWHEPDLTRTLDIPLSEAAKYEPLVLRDRQAIPELAPPYVLFANGDCLPGHVVAYEPSDARYGFQPIVRIALASPLAALQGNTLAVRADRVARIVTTSSPLPAAQENTVLLSGGRRIVPRSLRFTAGGLSLLTAEGLVTASFSELADVSLPVDRLQGVLEDSMAAGQTESHRIVRLTTRHGAKLTATRLYSYRERERSRDRRRAEPVERTMLALQPAWAQEPLLVPDEWICQSSFRKPNELPLSQLAGRALVEKAALGNAFPWRRDENVRRQPLASGDLVGDFGVGAHAHSEIAFDLPPEARELSLWVGIDRSVAEGGCVKCFIRSADAPGPVLWESGFLRGSDPPRRVEKLAVQDLKRVTLVTEMAHEGRPAGADPLDIRDDVAWLSPLVTIDLASIVTPESARQFLVGADAWSIDRDELSRTKFASLWSTASNRWDPVVALSRQSPFTFTRTLEVSAVNDVLEFVSTAPTRSENYDVELLINGKPAAWVANTDISRARYDASQRSIEPSFLGRRRSRETPVDDTIHYWWDLQAYRGQTVKLQLKLVARNGPALVTWRSLALRSAIANPPADGKLPVPDVLLTRLTPLEAKSQRERGEPLADAVPSRRGAPITFVGQKYTGGYGMTRNSSISFPVEPDYRRFVALAGACMEQAGALRVLVNGRVVWETPARSAAAGAMWIEVALPPDAKELTLETGPDGGYGGASAFANAGFLK